VIWNDYASSVGIASAVPWMQPMVVLETSMAVISLPLAVGGLVLLLRRSRYTPRYWVAYFALHGAYVLIDLAAMSLINPKLQSLVGAAALTETAGKSASQQWRILIGMLIWSLYWLRSQRVRATFAGAARDEAVVMPDAVDSTSLVRAPRRGVRVARVLGVLATACLTLALYVLWSIRATRYSTPEGRDIHTIVAGRWTWGSDTAGCARAHTIAFGDGGKVMTITSGDITATDPVTTYDVLEVSRSSIRGAIRGETRMTKDRKPVVWDLVLTGPDEYRWQRTDWPATPWTYTGKIRRCPAADSVSADRR
jgi:hypothetical protein